MACNAMQAPRLAATEAWGFMAFALYSRGRYVGYIGPIHWYDEMAKAAHKCNRKRRRKCTRGPHSLRAWSP